MNKYTDSDTCDCKVAKASDREVKDVWLLKIDIEVQ